MSYQNDEDEDDRLVWKREATIALIRLVRPHKLIWDQRHQLYMKTKMRQKIFRDICKQILQKYPYMEGLTPDLTREKFKLLKTYFRREYKKNCLSGCDMSKWDLYEHMEFLCDSIRSETASNRSIGYVHDKMNYEDEDSNSEMVVTPDIQSRDTRKLQANQANTASDTPDDSDLEEDMDDPHIPTSRTHAQSSRKHESAVDKNQQSTDAPPERKKRKYIKSHRYEKVYRISDELDQKRGEQLDKAIEIMINMASEPVHKAAESIAEAAAVTLKATINEFPPHKQYEVASRIMSVIFKIKEEMSFQNPAAADASQFKQIYEPSHA